MLLVLPASPNVCPLHCCVCRAGAVLNVHPSLLPQYRGPYPLFWRLRHGDRNCGVTIHCMDERFDTGDIAAQAEVEVPDGISGVEADTLLSEYGGECLVEVLAALDRGTFTRRPQPEGGSYFSAPREQDFVIDPAWSARRAFNFMRGTNEWSQLYPIELAEQCFQLKQALFYSADEILDQPYRLFGDQIDIQFSPGVLRALQSSDAAILNLARPLTEDSKQEWDLPPTAGHNEKQSWDQAVVGAFAARCERREERISQTVGKGEVTGRSAQETREDRAPVDRCRSAMTCEGVGTGVV